MTGAQARGMHSAGLQGERQRKVLYLGLLAHPLI